MHDGKFDCILISVLHLELKEVFPSEVWREALLEQGKILQLLGGEKAHGNV